MTKRADLYVGYNITKDTGDGRETSKLPTATRQSGQLLYSVQTFPSDLSDAADPPLRHTAKIRYNIGYQYYGYHEEFGILSVDQSYRAQTGYTSLLWSF